LAQRNFQTLAQRRNGTLANGWPTVGYWLYPTHSQHLSNVNFQMFAQRRNSTLENGWPNLNLRNKARPKGVPTSHDSSSQPRGKTPSSPETSAIIPKET